MSIDRSIIPYSLVGDGVIIEMVSSQSMCYVYSKTWISTVRAAGVHLNEEDSARVFNETLHV